MGSAWSDLDRPPLSAARLRRAVAGGRWRELRVVARTGSTNADVAAALRAGAGDGLVVVAEEQLAGRGRLGRTWVAPPRSAVLLSVGLVPPAPPDTWPLLPLVTGLAVTEALTRVAAVAPRLKWPNDVLVAGRKIAGILVERIDTPAGPAAVIGVGINVSTRPEELPVPTATSVAAEGGIADREPLVAETLRALDRWVARWSDDAGHGRSVLPAYRERCDTIGTGVTVSLPGGQAVTGHATGVDDSGRLVVREPDGRVRAWSAGEVAHLTGG